MMQNEPLISRILIQALFIFLVIIALYPLIWLIITSFKSQEQYLINKFNIEFPLYLKNFKSAIRGVRFFRWMMNSVIITAGSVMINGIVVCFGAYVFAKMPFKGSSSLLNFIISLMVIPPVVMIVPLFILYNQLNFHSTYYGIIIIYTGLTIPFSIYLMTNFFKEIPQELIEAVIMDGGSHFLILTKVCIPLSKPAFLTLLITNGLWIWNEILLALVMLPKDSMRTIMVGITTFKTKYMLDVPATMAGLLLSTIPMLLLYALFQKAFIKGLTEGSIKG